MTRAVAGVVLLWAVAALANPQITVDLPGGVTMDFVWIEPGTFLMGSPESDELAGPKERPQHQVVVSQGFWLGTCEVTQGQWRAVMGTEPWSGNSSVQSDPSHPAVCIEWERAQDFVAKLNWAAGPRRCRLPTEAEWEYACRAGTTTRWSSGDGETSLADFAWYYGTAWGAGQRYAHAVGTKRPNPWGLYDMHGNVCEWVQDWYGEYQAGGQTDPLDISGTAGRVYRGGDFVDGAGATRSAARSTFWPFDRYSSHFVGMRVLMTGPPPATASQPSTWGQLKRQAR